MYKFLNQVFAGPEPGCAIPAFGVVQWFEWGVSFQKWSWKQTRTFMFEAREPLLARAVLRCSKKTRIWKRSKDPWEARLFLQ